MEAVYFKPNEMPERNREPCDIYPKDDVVISDINAVGGMPRNLSAALNKLTPLLANKAKPVLVLTLFCMASLALAHALNMTSARQ